jgi:hypothetical protein
MPNFSLGGVVASKPSGLQRATVFRRGNTLACSGSRNIQNPTIREFQSFYEYLASIQQDKWCFQYLENTNDTSIATSIRNCQAKAVSDGSFKYAYGTVATIIEGTTKKERITAKVISPGGENDHSSYRSELAGIYTTLVLINHLFTYHNITEGSIEFACDGLSTLKVIFSNKEVSSEGSDGDLVMASWTARMNSPIQWTTRHVAGHQDDDPNHVLDEWEVLNIEADGLVKSHLSYAATQPRYSKIGLEHWMVWYKAQKLVGIKDSLYDIVHSSIARSYWEKEGKGYRRHN